MNRREFLIAGLSLAASPALAQGKYPERPVRMIVPRSAGGVIDVVARQWADKVKTGLGTVYIENQGGGGGTIGTAMTAHAQPDGYTLLMGSTSDLVLNPVLMGNSLYDPAKDFAPISVIAITVAAIMVHPSLPVHNLAELAAYAKANPGKLSYGSAGAGTMANLCGELFKQLAGTPDIVHIPYKGAGGGYADFISGNIPMMAANISDQTLEWHRSGKIRILAAATEKRLTGAPDIPTGAEAGYPGLVAQLFIALFAPANTSPAIVNQIATVTHEVMGDKDFQDKLLAGGFEPVLDSSPAKTAQYVTDELTRWTPILKQSGMKAG